MDDPWSWQNLQVHQFEEEPEEGAKPKPPNPATIDVQGWRRILLVACTLCGLFLGFLDTTIISVALPTIADDFNDFANSTWVVTSYLLTYMGKLCSIYVLVSPG